MKRKRSATQKLAQKSKKRIPSNRNIQITNSETSGQVSTKQKCFTILERSYQGNNNEVVVTRKDRFYRFAYELVKWILSKNGTKIMVLGSDVNIDKTKSGELAEDLLSIVTARHNELRSAENHKR
ncbi:hypothetical protein Glove_341g16 [Diversispora epigaea]|uniref:Resolvase/invertase-type recombinase catalytic domain-containing protein n=1 Tax=Diversispora epigaea TaxID=1348612 RepID=A0A397HH31_9GLOM|nr:hypothetical protein Glove_341g16 [Diversispora epigaea]